ncbi:MAG: DUF1476 domain-containing protein [Alphaproteobacteria bacterium]|nr:DUF1476 domain-containing protein [Alphaproteobacteria bacterium]
MTTFDKREKGFETKYKTDQEIEFKAQARRNKLLGLWAAEMMGISGEAADAYAREVVQADFEEPGEEDVFRKVFGDFQNKGVDCADHTVRKKMADLLVEAREQVKAE